MRFRSRTLALAVAATLVAPALAQTAIELKKEAKAAMPADAK